MWGDHTQPRSDADYGNPSKTKGRLFRPLSDQICEPIRQNGMSLDCSLPFSFALDCVRSRFGRG